MAVLDFISQVHKATKRDYLERVVAHDKAECAAIAGQWGFDYWDGDRKYGFGGMRYDGRWLPIAQRIAAHYGLKPGMRVLDVGCGKAFLLYELTQAVPGLEIAGLDISAYAVENAKPECQPFLKVGSATDLPWPDGHFDLVISINTFHNLFNYELDKALAEMTRVGKGVGFVCVEAYRNDHEKVNLLYWQLTCRTFHTPAEWQYAYDRAGYSGDCDFIYFE